MPQAQPPQCTAARRGRWFATKRRSGRGPALVPAHVARLVPGDRNALDAPVVLHSADCTATFEFLTAAETANDRDELGAMVARVYGFQLTARPAGCHRRIQDDAIEPEPSQ